MSVIIRKVRTALNREYQKAGGIRIEEAIEAADSNLGELTDTCLAQIDGSIERIAEMTADPRRRPDAGELRRIHTLVNEMLGSCAAIDDPGLVEALYAVARLVAALIATDSWLDGALTQAVNLLRLVRRGTVGPDDLKTLIGGVDQCTDRINRQPRPAVGR
jgi:hypothetical protein